MDICIICGGNAIRKRVDSKTDTFVNTDKEIIEKLQADKKELVDALRISANQLEGVSIAIKAHGQNINVDFFIDNYKEFAIKARHCIERVKELAK